MLPADPSLAQERRVDTGLAPGGVADPAPKRVVAGDRNELAFERALRYSRRDGLLTGGDAAVEGRLLAAIAAVQAAL